MKQDRPVTMDPPLDLDRTVIEKLVVFCHKAAPSEIWALVSPAGRIVVLDSLAPDATFQGLSPQALLRLAWAEDHWTDRGPWLLAHSHPEGRAVMSATDRLAVTMGSGPAWPFPLLIVGLAPEPALARYEWNTSSGTHRLVRRQSLSCCSDATVNQSVPATRPA